MKLNNYIFNKFFLSFSISGTVCIIIFFLFSIISNLGENFNFFKIFIISLINAMQLIFYIPTFISLLTIYLFWYFLNVKNEIIVIRQYLSKAKILLILLIFTITFSIIEARKDIFIDKLEKAKLSISGEEKSFGYKLIVLKDQNIEKYFLFKGVDLANKSIGNFNFYEIINNKINSSIYAEKQFLEPNSIYLSNYFEQKHDSISKNEIEKSIEVDNLLQTLSKDSHINIIDTKIESVDIRIIQKLIHFFLLNSLIILILFNNSTLLKKDNLINSLLISIFLIIYSYTLFTINLQTYDLIFIIIGTFVIFLYLIQTFLYE